MSVLDSGGGIFADGEKIADGAFTVLTDRRIEGYRVRDQLRKRTNAFGIAADVSGELLNGRLTSKFKREPLECRAISVQRFMHMYRKPDRTALVSNRSRNGLAYPPRCISRKFEAEMWIKLLHGPHQTEIPLLDKIREWETAIYIALGDRDGQPQFASIILFRAASLPASAAAASSTSSSAVSSACLPLSRR